MQASLFDHEGQPVALARKSDPPTSHQAAVEISGKLGYCAAGMLQAFKHLGEATASEAAAHAYDADGGKVSRVKATASEPGSWPATAAWWKPAHAGAA